MKYLISGNEGFLLLQREAKIIKRTFYNSKCCTVLSKDVSRLWLKLAQACITLTMFNNIYFSCLFWRKILLAPSFPFWSSPWVENRRSGKKDSMFSTLVSRISYYWDNSIIRLGSALTENSPVSGSSLKKAEIFYGYFDIYSYHKWVLER